MNKLEQDIKIIHSCVKGKAGAWNEFVERFSGLVAWSIKERLSKSGYRFTNQDSEDILQETFLSIYKENKLAGLKDCSKIAPWLCIIAGNIAMDKIRCIKGGILSERFVPLSENIENSGLALSDILKDDAPSAIENIEQSERGSIITEAINCLKPREKIVINLYYTNNNTIKEIASLLNMRQGSVSSLIARARKKIKKNMHKNLIRYRHI